MRAVKFLVVFIFLTLLFSCPDYNNPLDPEAENPSDWLIGETYEGGIVFYQDGFGSGLIAAESDQSTGIEWGEKEALGWTSEAVGKGAANTTMIVDKYGSGTYAAKLCDDLILNGYDDWFLPSKDELNLMYRQKGVIGGFADDYYWSSSEYDSGDARHQSEYAWFQNFGNGNQLYYYDFKTDDQRVRAVRAFTY